MSYANGTQFYNLPQTVGTDKRDWFDTNVAFAAIDAALHAAVVGQAADAEAISTINSKLAADEADIAALQTASSSQAASISTLQTAVNGQATQIADVRQDAEDMITANNEGAAATSTRAYAIGDYFIYNDVLYKATAAIAIGDTIVPNTNCEATNVDTEITQINSELYKDSVIVTANGVKTARTLLNELFTLVDKTKVTDTSYIEFERDNDKLIFEISYIGGLAVRYGHFAGGQLESLNLHSNESTYIRIDIGAPGGVTYTDKSQDVIETGRKFKLYY